MTDNTNNDQFPEVAGDIYVAPDNTEGEEDQDEEE